MSPLFYRQSGTGFPIVLIHGFCETHEIWDGFAENLAKKFQIFAIDLPGFGGSSLPPTPFSLDDVADHVLEWMKTIKTTNPIVVGHSLGGYVSLALAKKYSGISGLCLFQSTAYPDSDERRANRNRVIEFVKAHGKGPFIDTYVPGLFYHKKHPAISVVDSIARKTPVETLLAYTAVMRDRASSESFIRAYKKPLLIMGGNEDSIIPAETIREHARVAGNGRACLLTQTGHMAMYENPAEALAVLEEFASEIEANLLK